MHLCVFVGVLLFQTRSLICSLSLRFLSMHCCYRFRGGEKMHHACRSKVCWILNTAELQGRSVKKLLQVLSEQNNIASVSLFEQQRTFCFSCMYAVRFGRAGTTDQHNSSDLCRCTLLLVSLPLSNNEMRSLKSLLCFIATSSVQGQKVFFLKLFTNQQMMMTIRKDYEMSVAIEI